jgi:HAD superfamily hydrolase (TIGR01459 family)
VPTIGIPEITVDALIDRYAVLLLDAYGVLVTSSGPLPGAPELIARLNETGKPYYIVSNDASRLPATTVQRYQRFGLAVEAGRLITAGMLLVEHFARHGLRGTRCAVLGTADSVTYVEAAGGRPVPATHEFDAVVVCDESGFPFLETVDAVLSALFRAVDAERTVPLICANPDLLYPSGAGFGIASGAVAHLLEAGLALRYPRRALRFVRLGKPYPALFEAALQRSGTRNMVMIGDQIETDIRGGRAFGLDTALVTTGISAAPTSDDDVRPTYLLRGLTG